MRIRVTSKPVEVDVMRRDKAEILSGVRDYDDYIFKNQSDTGIRRDKLIFFRKKIIVKYLSCNIVLCDDQHHKISQHNPIQYFYVLFSEVGYLHDDVYVLYPVRVKGSQARPHIVSIGWILIHLQGNDRYLLDKRLRNELTRRISLIYHQI